MLFPCENSLLKHWTSCLPKIDALTPMGNKEENSYFGNFYMIKGSVILKNAMGVHFVHFFSCDIDMAHSLQGKAFICGDQY